MLLLLACSSMPASAFYIRVTPGQYNFVSGFPKQCQVVLDSFVMEDWACTPGDHIHAFTDIHTGGSIVISTDKVNWYNSLDFYPASYGFAKTLYFKYTAPATNGVAEPFAYVYMDNTTWNYGGNYQIVNNGTNPIVVSNNGPSCIGGNATFVTNFPGTAAFSWAGPGGVSSTTASPVVSSLTNLMAGVYTVTTTSSTGCSATSTTSLALNSLPGAIALTGDSAVCTGLSTTLATGASGSWSSSNTGLATVGTSGIVSALTAGNVTITYSSINNCGNAYIHVTVNPTPSAITGNAALCAGSTTTLGNAILGGTWNSSASSSVGTINASTGIFSATGIGTTTIIYTSGNCTATKMLTVETTPVVGTILKSSFTGSGIISNFAGNHIAGYSGNGGAATAAQLRYPFGVTTDQAGNVYIAEYSNAVVRKVTPSGIISTIAGTGVGGYGGSGGAATATAIRGPLQIALDAAGNVYFTDGPGNCIRKVSTSGVMTIVAGATLLAGFSGDGGPATAARLNYPQGIVVDANNNIFFGDAENYRIRKIDPSGTISTFAGNGDHAYAGNNVPVLTASFGGLGLMCLDKVGALYVADGGNAVRKIVNGIITTVAGNGTAGLSGDGGPATAATLSQPTGVKVDTLGNIYIADYYNYRIRKVNQYGIISTIAGSTGGYAGDGGPATAAKMYQATDIAIDKNGDLLVADPQNNVIRKITKEAGVSSGIASICGGTSLNLENATIGGSWSSSNTDVATVGTNGIVTAGATGGSALISYTITNSCGATTVTTSVNTTAVAAPITGTHAICISESTTYFNPATGGTWSSGNTSVASISSTSGILTGVTTGTTIITYTVNNGCGITTATYSVTVNQIPVISAITGATALCQGNTLTLSNPATGGTWSSGNTIVATIDGSGILTGATPGTTQITYSLTNTCGTSIATKQITVNVNPGAGTITGASTVSVGATITLANAVSGGSWTSNATAIATVSAGGVVTGVAGGTSIISYTVVGSCGTATATKTINVGVAPTSATYGNLQICAGATSTLSNTIAGGTWTSGTTSVASVNSTTGVVTGNAAGTSTITYTTASTTTFSTVTVMALPAITPGTMPTVCAGATSASIPYTGASGSMQYNITWDSAAEAAGFSSTPGIITTIAGDYSNATYSGDGGSATTAGMAEPRGLTTDASGNLYIADKADQVIRKVTTAGVISTVAGFSTSGFAYSGDGGPATDAALNLPADVKADAAGNLYIADLVNNVIRKVNTAGIISTVAGNNSIGFSYSGDGGPATAAGLNQPSGIALDAAGNIYIADEFNNVVRKVATSGTISTVAGSNSLGGTYSGDGGAATAAGLSGPCAITVDASGNLYIADRDNLVIRKVTTSGIISTYAGGGTGYGSNDDGFPATDAYIYYPQGVVIDGTGNLFIADGQGTVRKVNTSGIISTVVGTTGGTTRDYTGDGGPATAATAIFPAGITVDASNNILFSDYGTFTVRKVSSTLSLPASPLAISVPEAAMPGTYSGMLTVYNGACSNSYPISVSVGTASAPISGSSGVCAGATITLSNATSGGTWSSGNTSVATIGSTGIVTGIAGGTATISYTAAGSCGSPVTAVITVNPAPNAGTIVGAATVSTGSDVTLTDAMMGGVWSGSNANATVSPTGVVTGVAAGAVTASYTITNSCGSNVATKVITVTTSLTNTTGTLTVCTGATTTLENTTTGGYWTSSTTAIAYVNTTGVVTGMAAGTATISYTVAGATTTVVVTVSATPAAISGTASMCAGNSVTLTDATTGGTWNSDANASVTAGGVVTGITAGTAIVTYTSGNGCSVNKTLTIYAAPATIAGTANTCIGAATTLTNTVTGGTWSSTATSIVSVGAASGIVTGLAAGTATITYTVAGGCKTTTGFTVNAAPAAITGTMKACPGTNTTLADATSGGTWTSGDMSIASIGSVTGIVTGTAAGVVTINYSSGAGCSRTTTVTINPLPAAIAGTTSICTGSTTALTDPTTGGLSWTSSNTAIATINTTSGMATGVAVGTATITYTLGTGCFITTTLSVNALPTAISGTLKVCAGAATTLASGTGTWSSSNTTVATIGSSTGIATGVAAGTTTITYAESAGCYRTAVLTVTATPAAIAGYGITCLGASVSLTDATGGGTWSSGNTAIATVGSTTGVITGTGVGNTNITYTLGGACSVVKVVTINATLAPSTGTAIVCMGGTTTLANTTTDGMWTSSNTGIATVDASSGVVTTLYSTGTVNITYAIGTIACRTVKTITINPIPAAITGTTTVCTGAATTLYSGAGGTWSSTNTSVGTIGSISTSSARFSALTAGNTTISYTLPTGCARTTVVTVNPAPNAGAITSSGGFVINTATPPTSVMLSSTGDAGGAWTSNNTTVATIDGTGTVTAAHAGTTNISYTVTLGSCTARATHTVNVVAARSVTATGSSTSSMTDVSIYPNPNSGVFTVKGMIATEATQAAIEVTNMAGQVVLRNTAVITDGIINEQIHLGANLANGMYMLTLRSGEEIKVFHFVIQQ